MARRLIHVRLPPELVAALEEYAVLRGSTKTALIEAACWELLASAEGGVPDLPLGEAGR